MKKAISMFITRSEYDVKLIVLYILNVTDYIFTLILLSSGHFIEANPLLYTGINGVGGFVLKCVVPLVLVLYLHIRFIFGKPKNQKAVNLLLNIILSYYAFVNLMHIFWLCVMGVIIY